MVRLLSTLPSTFFTMRRASDDVVFAPTNQPQEKLLAEHEASASAGDSKLNAAAAERRAAEARAEGLQRELAAAEGRLEESARLLASNQQVIKWLNKELNDVQMVPGGVSTAAASALAGTEAFYGGVPSSPPQEHLGNFNYGDVDARDEQRGRDTGGGGSAAKSAMFTAGIRESLTGGVRWNLRGTTLDDGGQNDAYLSRRGEPAEEEVLSRMVEGTPDHAGRGNEYGVGGVGYSQIVTPESADASDPGQTSSRFLPGDGKRGEYEGGGGDRDDRLAARVGGSAVREIRAF